jgi:hypothetical protein
MMAPHLTPGPGKDQTRSRAILVSILAFGFLLPSLCSGQSASDKRAVAPGAALDAQVEQSHVAIRQVAGTAACTDGTATLGVPVNGNLTSTDCSSSTTSGTLYADFYVFTATAGHTLTVTSHSSLGYLATIQDFTSGAVLASSGSCGNLEDDCTFTYTALTSGHYVLGFGAYSFGSYTMTVSDSAPPPTCGNTTTLCLSGSQFTVTVHWSTNTGASGEGTAIPLSGDTGYFWFFNSANVELVVKVLDGRAINGHFWVFYGALSDVSYTIDVTNTANGASRLYTNPQGNLASVADTAAF